MAIFRVTVGITWNGEGQPGANVWHYRTGDTGELAALETGLESLRTFYTAISALYPSSAVLTIADDVARIDGEEVTSVPFSTTTMPGTGTGGEAPELLAMVCSWKTLVRTRSGTGRTFIGPLTTGVMDTDGTPFNTRQVILLNAAKALRDRGAALDGTGAFGVYSRLQNVIRDFTDVSVRADQFSVLRSRRD